MARSAVLAAAILAMAGAAPASADPSGSWNTSKAKVRIADCGGGLCATIVSLKEPNDEKGAPQVDSNNPDAGKRARPIVGLAIMSGLKREGDHWSGQIYNPEDGRTYKGTMTEKGSDQLAVKGCALAGLVCKTQTWKRSD